MIDKRREQPRLFIYEGGDYWGAGISALGIIPYLGDLAKIGKLPKLLKTVEKVVEMAKADGKFAKVVEPMLKGLKNAIDALPINKLPNWAKEPIEKLSTKIDEFFGIRKVTKSALTAGGQKAVTLDTLEHIFHGDINKKGKAVGFHYEGVENMQAVNKTKTVSVTKPADKNGVYVATVDVKGVSKKADSSFFPKHWTKNYVVKAINESYVNKTFPNASNPLYFEGKSSSGVWVAGFLKQDGTIATAFPLYGR